jgi:Coenzyme PQQ synthesis protein D (PqqD)
MNQINIGSVLGRRADVRFRVIDTEGVVVRQSAAEVLVLNDLGTRILALADGVAPVAQWIDTLLGEFEVDRPVLERDVVAFAAELVEQGLLEPAPAGGRRLPDGHAAGGPGDGG